jgi:hypothetical protein
MLSSVETAFPNPTPILEAGGYCQALGFDYDWTQSINTSGLALASFINSLMRQGMTFVDIEAHSGGVAVSLSAARYTSMPITNMVLLGGPIVGTPAANTGSTLVSLFGYWPVPAPSFLCVFGHSLADIETGQFVQDMADGSQTMYDIVDQFVQIRKSTHVIEIAGTSPTLLGNGVLAQYFNYYIFGVRPNDGLIPVTSALALSYDSLTIPTVDQVFDLNHIQLETNPSVIDFVGSYITLSNDVPILALGTNQLFIDACSNYSALCVSNAGSGCTILNFSVVNAPSWLVINPSNGDISPGDMLLLNIVADTNSLFPGTNIGTFTVANTTVPTNYQTVTLTATAASPSIALDTNQLTFVGGCGTTNLPLMVSNSGPICSTLNYTITSDQPWLTVSPTNGVLVGGGGLAHLVSVNPSNLTSGTYSGTLTILDSSYPSTTTNVSVSFAVDTNQLQSFLGTWSGTWTGESVAGVSVYLDYDFSTPISGTWAITLQQVDGTITGSMNWQGNDAFWLVPFGWNYDGYTNGATSQPLYPNLQAGPLSDCECEGLSWTWSGCTIDYYYDSALIGEYGCECGNPSPFGQVLGWESFTYSGISFDYLIGNVGLEFNPDGTMTGAVDITLLGTDVVNGDMSVESSSLVTLVGSLTGP